SAAYNFVFVGEKICESDAFIRHRGLRGQRFGRPVVAGRNFGRSTDVFGRNEITSDNRLRPEPLQGGAKGIIARRRLGKEAIESDNLYASPDETFQNKGVNFAVPRPTFAHDLKGATRLGIAGAGREQPFEVKRFIQTHRVGIDGEEEKIGI